MICFWEKELIDWYRQNIVMLWFYVNLNLIVCGFSCVSKTFSEETNNKQMNVGCVDKAQDDDHLESAALKTLHF